MKMMKKKNRSGVFLGRAIIIVQAKNSSSQYQEQKTQQKIFLLAREGKGRGVARQEASRLCSTAVVCCTHCLCPLFTPTACKCQLGKLQFVAAGFLSLLLLRKDCGLGTLLLLKGNKRKKNAATCYILHPQVASSYIKEKFHREIPISLHMDSYGRGHISVPKNG